MKVSCGQDSVRGTMVLCLCQLEVCLALLAMAVTFCCQASHEIMFVLVVYDLCDGRYMCRCCETDFTHCELCRFLNVMHAYCEPTRVATFYDVGTISQYALPGEELCWVQLLI